MNAVTRPHRDPIFVLGTQKSGTSVIAALLGHATGLPTTIDLKPISRDSPFPQKVAEGSLDFDELVRRHRWDFSRPIVKEPSLTFVVPFLRTRWPSARMVFVRRDPVQVVRSVLDRLRIPGCLRELSDARRAAIPPPWRQAFDCRWCERGVPGGCWTRPRMHYVEEAARRCRIAESIAENELSARPHSTFVVDYDEFRLRRMDIIEELARSLGLDPRPRDRWRSQVDRRYQPAGRNAAASPEEVFGDNLPRLRRAFEETRESYKAAA